LGLNGFLDLSDMFGVDGVLLSVIGDVPQETVQLVL
jgi:hypothetical protein